MPRADRSGREASLASATVPPLIFRTVRVPAVVSLCDMAGPPGLASLPYPGPLIVAGHRLARETCGDELSAFPSFSSCISVFVEGRHGLCLVCLRVVEDHRHPPSFSGETFSLRDSIAVSPVPASPISCIHHYCALAVPAVHAGLQMSLHSGAVDRCVSQCGSSWWGHFGSSIIRPATLDSRFPLGSFQPPRPSAGARWTISPPNILS